MSIRDGRSSTSASAELVDLDSDYLKRALRALREHGISGGRTASLALARWQITKITTKTTTKEGNKIKTKTSTRTVTKKIPTPPKPPAAKK